MKPLLKGGIIGATGIAVLLLVVALLIVLTGGYNVAATERHTTVGEWALDTNFTNSVQRQAEGVSAPEFTSAMVDAGAPDYKAMCAHCHGGIGEPRAKWAEGMRPKPPALAHTAQAWSAEEIYWLIENGAKMTGMPAFGPTHDEQSMWNIAAFVKAMPEMTEARYAAYSSESGRASEAGHGHGGTR